MSSFDFDQPSAELDFYFEPEPECLSPVKGFFALPRPTQAAHSVNRVSGETELLVSCAGLHPSDAAGQDSLTSACLSPAAERGSFWSMESRDTDLSAVFSETEEAEKLIHGQEVSLSQPTHQRHDLQSNTLAAASAEAGSSHYFWNSASSTDSMGNVAVSVCLSKDCTAQAADVSLWTSETIQVDYLLSEVQHTMWAGEEAAAEEGNRRAGKGGGGEKQPCRKPNKVPLPWTAEEHEKFVAGLEKFGLQDRLGPGGAELMSVYMGNRSVLQIKSHMQQYLLNRSRARRHVRLSESVVGGGGSGLSRKRGRQEKVDGEG